MRVWVVVDTDFAVTAKTTNLLNLPLISLGPSYKTLYLILSRLADLRQIYVETYWFHHPPAG
jgi:hypothetical protein